MLRQGLNLCLKTLAKHIGIDAPDALLLRSVNETAVMIGVPRQRGVIDHGGTRLVPHWVWEYG